MISECADQSELKDNLRAAKAILEAFPDTEIKIRQHVIEEGVKNPEYDINGSLADRKGIAGLNGVADGFKKAIKQGCSIVVIDLDKQMADIEVDMRHLSRRIYNRKNDFINGVIEACYVVYKNKAVRIIGYREKNEIESILNGLRP